MTKPASPRHAALRKLESKPWYFRLIRNEIAAELANDAVRAEIAAACAKEAARREQVRLKERTRRARLKAERVQDAADADGTRDGNG